MHKFLLVRLGSLGDVVHAIPVAAALRTRFPAARIDWMIDPRYVPLLQLVPAVDGHVAINPRRDWRGLPSLLRDLRRVGYDAAIDLQGLLKSAVLARAAGALRTIGFPKLHLREPAARMFYGEMPDPGDAVHVVRKNLALLRPLGVREPPLAFPLEVPRTEAGEEVAARTGGKGYVLMAAGAGWPNKCWSPERFGALAAALRARQGLMTVVLWGRGEEGLAETVVAASEGAALVAPPTTIPDLAAIAKGAAVMVAGDTGPLHMAAAVGTPVVAIFGPSRPERNGPWAEADRVVSRTAGCVCLYERRCRRGRSCLDEVPVDEVLDAVLGRLRRSGA
jgi:heptosyltransferase I